MLLRCETNTKKNASIEKLFRHNKAIHVGLSGGPTIVIAVALPMEVMVIVLVAAVVVVCVSVPFLLHTFFF